MRVAWVRGALVFVAGADSINGQTKSTRPALTLFDDTLDAVRVMQNDFFQPWVGTWPTAIDWTAAVMGTQVTGALHSLSRTLETMRASGNQGDDFKAKENLVSLYFSQLVGFYFGQDSLSLRGQAFDDMLWVVLGWLDATRFIKDHSNAHFDGLPGVASFFQEQGWYGNQWTAAFAHRARIFWHLAERGWDTRLCGGGMNWNPSLSPYKNAITNELWISASVAMYLDFPGDSNSSPFGVYPDEGSGAPAPAANYPPKDRKYLRAAVNGYSWLVDSQMMNSQGLYADGFHISGYPQKNRTKCDSRDEMVYTYNQGVVLSGLRGLFRVTGNPRYLEDGHDLIASVIAATGWDLRRDVPLDAFSARLPRWYGLGRAGVLEDACDITGSCSQDAQTFKGIWMHHFATFCAPLKSDETRATFTDSEAIHLAECKRYIPWLYHNARAARGTRDSRGRFGMWWTAGLLDSLTTGNMVVGPDALPDYGEDVVDYRNDGVPQDETWVGSDAVPEREGGRYAGQRPIVMRAEAAYGDVNDRGRGRTVETQSGGLALLRALVELERL